ncbi:MAG: hypothetical protein M1836_001383 [Candelina mexicana]|nr:MAG: hypothetical protein M1836_001383 [Candelina mexicana]
MAVRSSTVSNAPSNYGIGEAAARIPVPSHYLESMQLAINESRCRPVESLRPSRGQFLKRILSRRGKASRSMRTESVSSHDDFTSDRQGKGHESNSDCEKGSARSASDTLCKAAEFVATPSPHTHPLKCKPEPRDDWRPRPCPDVNDTVLRAKVDGGKEKAVTARDVYVRNLRKREMMAVRAAAERKHVQEWSFYLKCYSEGRLNLSTPPVPPPRNSQFDYLSAPLSTTEERRLVAVSKIKLVLRSLGRTPEAAERIAFDAKRTLRAKHASVSFVDWESEVMIAGWGYNRAVISRNASIGAHAILCNEVMMIADAGKDWRLAKNPLVCGAPYVSFYAGAPLVTGDGHAVGVLAIFDPEPRADFQYNLRRKLQDFAKAVMLSFEGSVTDEERQEQSLEPILKGHLMKSPLNIPVATTAIISHQRTEPRKRTQTLTARLAASAESQSQQVGDHRNHEPLALEDTPPPSDHSSEDPPDGYSADLRAIAMSAIDQVPAPSVSQNKPSFPCNFSSRNGGLKSPPQTPPRPSSVPIAGARLSQPFHKVPREKILTIAPPPYLAEDNGHYSPTESHLAGSTVTSTPNTASATPAKQFDRRPHSPDTLKPVFEATFRLCLLASKVDYDLIYLLRVCSSRPPDQGDDQTSITTELLFSHGMPDPCPTFDACLHLHALRSAGGIVYENPKQDISHYPIAYTSGIIIPILRDNTHPDAAKEEDTTTTSYGEVGYFPPDRNCTGGVVLAAFKKQPGGADDFSPDIVASIAKAGHALKDLLPDAH